MIYRHKISTFLTTVITTTFVSTSLIASSFNSAIFSFDDPANATGIHVSLSGDAWTGREFQARDTKDYVNIRLNPVIMSQYANGQVVPESETLKRIATVWEPRLKAGQPHSVNSIFVDDKFVGFTGAGGGSRSGVAEWYIIIGDPYYSETSAEGYLPNPMWGKGIGKSVATTIFGEWAPEVRRIGLGIDLDESNAKIQKAFCCFGGKALESIEATASNPASMKILTRGGFGPETVGVVATDINLDFTTRDDVATSKAFDEYLFKLFDSFLTANPLVPGTLYQLTDPDGQKRTFTLSEKYNRLKYYYTRKVDV